MLLPYAPKIICSGGFQRLMAIFCFCHRTPTFCVSTAPILVDSRRKTMNRIPTTTLVLIFAGFFLMSQTGCRSRCNQSCGGGGLFAQNTTVAPASTYSLNIPSLAQNRPYTAPNGGPITTTARAPVPINTQPTNSSNSNLQWRQRGSGSSGSTFGTQPTQPASGTRLVEVNNGINLNTGSSVLAGSPQNIARVAATQPLPATGTSFTDSRNFATTQIDERLDTTRVPVTDATQVRATAQTYIGASQQIAFNQPQPTQTFAAQPAIAQPQSVYSTNAQVASTQPYYTNNPNLAQRQAIYSGQTFVQNATPTTYSASANNDIGWRNREIGSQR